MNKRFLRQLAIGSAVIAILGGIVYAGLYTVTKQRYQDAFAGMRIDGFRLYLDGVVLHHVESDDMVLDRVYLNGKPWRIYQGKPDYVHILKATIKPKALFHTPIQWPFANTTPLMVEKFVFHATLMDKPVTIQGTAKKVPETPLLADFHVLDTDITLQGKAELRFREGNVQMVDLEFEDASINRDVLQLKRGSGWLSYSFEQDWQVIGEIESGITAFSNEVFSDTAWKLNGPALSPDMTFSGQHYDIPVEVTRRDGQVTLQKNGRNFRVPGSAIDAALLDAVQVTLEKEYQLAQAEWHQQAEREEKRQEEERKAAIRKKETANPPEPEETETAHTIHATFEPEAAPVPQPVAPVTLPAVRLETLLAPSALKGFAYTATVVPVKKPCDDGIAECWTAYGKDGILTYDMRHIPDYFIKLKNYEESRVLQEALLDFQVEAIRVKGKGDQATEILLKGMTSAGQPAEIQLSVLALE